MRPTKRAAKGRERKSAEGSKKRGNEETKGGSKGEALLFEDESLHRKIILFLVIIYRSFLIALDFEEYSILGKGKRRGRKSRISPFFFRLLFLELFFLRSFNSLKNLLLLLLLLKFEERTDRGFLYFLSPPRFVS